MRIAEGLLGLVVALAACAAPEPGETPTVEAAPAVEPNDFRADLSELGRRYGVEITWQGGPYRYDYDWGWGEARDAAEWEIEAFAPILVDELGLYPPDFFRKANVRRIVLARDLWLEQQGVAQNISGYIFGDTILMSVSYTYKVNNRDKQRRYLHHLFWHQIDGVRGTTWEDPEWIALNPSGFEYGVHTRGGIHDRSPETGLLSTAFPGFINRYGTGNVPDDKADLFAYLMVLHDWVEERAGQDPFLRSKVDVIRRRLAEFDTAFDDAFWVRVADVDRAVTPYVTP